ncbi:carbonic anhydrase [Haliangium sp.]|uniref:carbonic anhydrase n=1 Tax=Haliangium sp. TaxID=2663208 RepID=UPI003D10CDDA
MQKLIEGLRQFMDSLRDSDRAFFEALAGGQRPETLFITCSDSRVVPSLFTQTEPGDLFTIRNAGNLVPPASDDGSGEAAAIEFAVRGLQVRDIVVCGHSHCGAIQGLMEPARLATLPLVARWLEHARDTRRIVDERHPDADEATRLQRAIEVNVLVQLSHLTRHPAVAERLADASVHLYGWVYDIATGEVMAFDTATGGFTRLAEVSSAVAGLSGPELGRIVG